MGLAASQARYLALTAQQTNLQYQGQQINQERSVLAQQTAELYNTLLALDVPTPPSTKAYTKVQYQGKSGGVQYSFDASCVIPQENNKYIITLNQTVYGSCMNETANTATVRLNTDEIRGTMIEGDGTQTRDTASTYYVLKDGDWEVADKDEDFENGKLKKGVRYLKKGAGKDSITIKQEGSFTVGGHKAYSLDEAVQAGVITKDQRSAYETGIKNAELTKDDGVTKLEPKDFLVYKDDDGKVHFVLQEETTSDENNANIYEFNPTGEYIKKDPREGCELEFDPSTGRITSIKIPNKDGSGMTSVSVEANEVTDTVAYDKANADYKYKQYLYDKEQQDINARIEIIQKQDRNLELKLSRLDTQNKEIDTEIEALKKVLEKNIEDSFKTFNG